MYPEVVDLRRVTRAAAELDRRAGVRLRGDRASDARAAALAARSLAPVFRLAVTGMVALPATRRPGAEALASGVLAAAAARLLRDRLGRPRPGCRPEGGFPSRHAAAAVAIARAAARADRRLGAGLGVLAGVGLVGRVLVGEHEPADIGAGAALGWLADRAVEGLVR